MKIRRQSPFVHISRHLACAACMAVFTMTFQSAKAAPAENPQAAEKAGDIVIIAFGDSLTAGYQLPPDKSFPAQLEAALRAKGHHARVLNAGVSGDTASGGLARLDWAVPENADAVIVELGANDALRAIDPAATKAALDAILTRLKAKNVEILLTGFEAPRGLGERYIKAFSAMYRRLAAKHGVALYPFFLRNVALRPELNLADGLHPNPQGVAVLVKSILPDVEALIERTGKKNTGSRRSSH